MSNDQKDLLKSIDWFNECEMCERDWLEGDRCDAMKTTTQVPYLPTCLPNIIPVKTNTQVGRYAMMKYTKYLSPLDNR